jgi:predicted nucleic acid-binding protein
MIVLDTDISTLLSYGTNEKLNGRIDDMPEGEELAVTVITFMEILGGRFASIEKAANEDELLKRP